MDPLAAGGRGPPPSAARHTIPPGGVELLTWPVVGGSGGEVGGGGGSTSTSTTTTTPHLPPPPAVQILVGDGRAWSPPLALEPAAAAGGDGPAALLRARVGGGAAALDLAVTVEAAAAGGPQGGATPSGASPAAAAPWGGGRPPLVLRLSPRWAVTNVTGVALQVAPYHPGEGGGSEAAGPPVLDLPPGPGAVPLSWPALGRRRAVVVRLAMDAGGAPAGAWSLPLDVDGPTDGPAYAALPTRATGSGRGSGTGGGGGGLGDPLPPLPPAGGRGLARVSSVLGLAGAGAGPAPVVPPALREALWLGAGGGGGGGGGGDEEGEGTPGAVAAHLPPGTAVVFSSPDPGTAARTALPATALRYAVERAPGGRLVLWLLAAAAAPPSALVNVSDAPLVARRPGLPWRPLPPLSAVPYLPQVGAAEEIEIADALSVGGVRGGSVGGAIAAAAAGSLAGPALAAARYPLGGGGGLGHAPDGGRRERSGSAPSSSTIVRQGGGALPLLRVESLLPGTTTLAAHAEEGRPGGVGPAGCLAPLAPAGGAAVGRGAVLAALRLAPLSQGSGSGGAATLGGPATGHAHPAGPPLALALEAGRVEVSLVDHRPEELLAASLSGLAASYAARLGADGAGERVVLDVGGLQVDDMAFGPRYPVVLAPSAASSGPGAPSGGGGTVPDPLAGAAPAPLLHAIALARRSSAASGGGAFYPLLGAWVDRPLALAVGEGFVWRCAAAAARVGEGGGPTAAAAAPSASSASSATLPSTAEAETDPPVRAALVVAGPIAAAVSFRADRAARPRWARRRVGAAAWVLDVASFERATVRLAGFEAEAGGDGGAPHALPRSAFWGGLAGRLRTQAVGAGLALVRSVDVLSSASGVLGALSDGVAGLAADESYAAERAAARGERTISGVGSGLAEGGSALGRGILRGVTGLVARPLKGALRTGVGGFVRGVGSGLVGVVTQPVAGGLDFVSSALEGLDALAGEGGGGGGGGASGASSTAGSAQRGGPDGGGSGAGTDGRVRLPRVAGGGPAALGLPPGCGGGEAGPTAGSGETTDSALQLRLLGGPASPAARVAELGQELLRRGVAATAVAAAAGAGAGGGGGAGSGLPPGAAFLLGPGAAASGTAAAAAARAGGAAAYGAHWVLPGDRALVATDVGCALLTCPGLGGLQRAAEAGRVAAPLPGTAVSLWWVVAWRDVLAAEARASTAAAAAGRPADRVVLHRVGGGDGGSDASLPLAIGLKTSPAWAQADALAGALEAAAAAARGEGVRAEAAAWERLAAGAAGGPGAPATSAASPVMPLALPCVDFALVWHTAGRPGGVVAGAGGSLSGGAPVSIWRPLPPAGYASTGDVAVHGLDPPPVPVSVYRLEVGNGNGGGGGGESSSALLPPTAPAAGFRLVWRGTGGLPVTLWEPRPPPGYVALGAVSRGAPAPPRGWRARARALARPPSGEVTCLRADLVEPAPLFAAPLWRWDPAAGRGAGLGAAQAAPPYDPASWRVALWQVDSPAGGFIAERSFEAPGGGAAVRPKV